MSIQSIATQLYVAKSKKNISLSAAFSTMLREELAARFSVYNLVRSITRSQLIATMAHYKFGKLTPLQKKETEQQKKSTQQDMRFKQFAATSIVNLNRKINTLTSITQKNTQLIQSLYDQLGGSRYSRAPNVLKTSSSLRVPGRSKTVRAQIEQLQNDLAILSKQKVYTPKKRTKVKTEEKKDSKDLAKTLGVAGTLGALGAGAGWLVTSDSLVANTARDLIKDAANTAFNIVKAAPNRMMARLKGERPTFFNPISGEEEPVPDWVNDIDSFTLAATGGIGAILATGALAGTAKAIKVGKGIANIFKAPAAIGTGTGAGSVQLGKGGKPLSGAALKSRLDKLAREAAARPSAEKIKGAQINPKVKLALSKLGNFLLHNKTLRRIIPGYLAARGLYILNEISILNMKKANKEITEIQFKNEVIPLYTGLAEMVGVTGMGMLLGAIGGTVVGGPLGTVGGLAAGLLGGGAISLALMATDKDENFFGWVGNKIYDIIDGGNTTIDLGPSGTAQNAETGETTATATTSTPGTTSVNRLEGDGNGVESILETIRLQESSNNYRADLLLNQAAQQRARSLGYSKASASGAYQFTDSTWRRLTKKYHIGTQYERAVQAPPNIQDAVAAAHVKEILVSSGGDISKVPLVWYTGNEQGRLTPGQAAMNSGLTASSYQTKWLQTYSRITGAPVDTRMASVSSSSATTETAATAVSASFAENPELYMIKVLTQLAQTSPQKQQNVSDVSTETTTTMIADNQSMLSDRVDQSQMVAIAALGAYQNLGTTIGKMQSSIVDLANAAKGSHDFYVDNLDPSLSNYRLS